MFCCVILGNVEVVSPGSVQCHPSTEDFDSGVDDLQSPHHYIVWNMNVNTHIFPEYVVCFKMSLGADGGMFLLFSFPSMFNALLVWRTLETILYILYTLYSSPSRVFNQFVMGHSQHGKKQLGSFCSSYSLYYVCHVFLEGLWRP